MWGCLDLPTFIERKILTLTLLSILFERLSNPQNYYKQLARRSALLQRLHCLQSQSFSMATNKYTDILLDISNRVGTIKLNRPKALNSFGGNLMIDIVQALRELNNHPDSVFTVITGEGRFFSAGADVKASGAPPKDDLPREADKKVAFMSRYALAVEMLRSMIDHKKVLVVALNGPGVGGGAAWFPGVGMSSPATACDVFEPPTDRV